MCINVRKGENKSLNYTKMKNGCRKEERKGSVCVNGRKADNKDLCNTRTTGKIVITAETNEKQAKQV